MSTDVTAAPVVLAGGSRLVDTRRARTRRVLVVLGLSLVLPGSGLLVLGHRALGRVVLRTWLAVLALVAAVALVAVISPGTLAQVAVRPSLLGAVRLAVTVVALGWGAVLVGTALAARPHRAGRRALGVATVLVVAATTAVAVPVQQVRAATSAQQHLVEDLFAAFPDDAPPGRTPPGEALDDDRLTVLLVGSDQGEGRIGSRTDTMMLVSLDVDTGVPLVVALPRNMERVPFAAGSPMAEAFPDGFDCDGCYLNAVWTWASERPELFPDDPLPGMAALRSAVSEVTAVDVDYHVLVDFAGFQGIVDALGGVRLRVAERLPIGGLDERGREVRPEGWIEPGVQTMDGETALWYARSRAGSTDYARMARQRCLLGAVRAQADTMALLRNWSAVARSTAGAVQTDVPRELLPDLLDAALASRSHPIRSLSLTPPLVPDTADPDFPAIRDAVREALEAPAEAASVAPPAQAGAAPIAPPPADGAPVVERTDTNCQYS